MSPSFDGLHVLIDPVRVPPSRLVTFMGAIQRGGASVVQIRIKGDVSTREALKYIEGAAEEAHGRGLVVVINDRVDWAAAVGADGVHLGQTDMPSRVARHVAPSMSIGLSCGNREELRSSLGDHPAYLGIGPVFSTPSKSDAGDALGVSGLRDLCREIPQEVPVVAIGGIQPHNAKEVWAAGVAGIAVIGAVADSADPEAACRALVAARMGGR